MFLAQGCASFFDSSEEPAAADELIEDTNQDGQDDTLTDGEEQAPQNQATDLTQTSDPLLSAPLTTDTPTETHSSDIKKTSSILITGIAGLRPPNGLPEFGSKIPYVVKKGESLSTIAKKIYGKKEAWKQIATWTGMDDDEVHHINPGDVVYFQLTETTKKFAENYQLEHTKLKFT